jgi:hypothetical protein
VSKECKLLLIEVAVSLLRAAYSVRRRPFRETVAKFGQGDGTTLRAFPKLRKLCDRHAIKQPTQIRNLCDPGGNLDHLEP